MENTEELFSKILDVRLTSKGGAIYPTLQKALNVAKAYGHSVYLDFPKGYSIRIWPDSTINDLVMIEELENKIFNMKNP